MFDFSEHTLTQISTWAVVTTLLFMLWQYFEPRIRGPAVNIATQRQSGFWPSLWENRTVILAIFGLGIVIWLHFGLSQPSPADLGDAVSQKDYELIGNKLEAMTNERNGLKQTAEKADEKLAILQQEVQNVKYEIVRLSNDNKKLEDNHNDMVAILKQEVASVERQRDMYKKRCR